MMMANVDIYENHDEGIKCVYQNGNWLISIKNWKPDNDIGGISRLEIHHESDEQFILSAGKAILISADSEGGKITDISLTEMEKGKVYNVPKEMWFYSITQKDTKMMYVQAANTSLDNSDFISLSEQQIKLIQNRARELFSK
jgi:hypothetical protein